MFEYLSGEIAARRDGVIVLDVGGVGYRIEVPASAMRVLPESGCVRLWVVSRISQERIELFGFPTAQERDLFETMVETIPALGPRKAIRILSEISVAELLEAVRRGDGERLKNVKGIGEKLAGRLVMELRGRLPSVGESGAEGSSHIREAVLALVSLGYGRSEAENAVGRTVREGGSGLSLEELVKRSLGPS